MRQLAQRPAAVAGDQRDRVPRQLVDADCTRASGTPNTAPMLARTALGLNGSALLGPRATDAAPKACALRSTAPTLPGSRHAMQINAQRSARRRRPALLVDGQRARPGPQCRRPMPAAPARPRCPPARCRPRSSARAAGQPAASAAAEQVLAFGDEAAAALAPAPTLAELADLLELLVVVAGDRSSVETKKAPALVERRPGGGAGVVGCLAQPAASASRARSAKRRKVSASRTAMSARILRSSSTPAVCRPCMNCE